MNLMQKLAAVQADMKAPKNLFNSFGGYKYRNAEGICEAFKPFGKKYTLVLMLSDKIVEIGGRIYVQATASLFDAESETPPISVTALAREPECKKGMDDSQITGTASSYARKYALNGLFLLDDTKDADSDEYHRQTQGEQKSGYPSRDDMISACESYYKGENLEKLLGFYKVSAIKYLKKEQLMVAYNKATQGKQ